MGSGYEIARAVERLIHLGHDKAWSYTPRQISAWIELADRRAMHDRHQLITAMAAAQNVSHKDVKKEMKGLEEQSR